MKNKTVRYAFNEIEPRLNSHICLVWEDGSECECIYTGLDKTILPLPTHWFYVESRRMKMLKSFYNWLHRTWVVMAIKVIALVSFLVIVYGITVLIVLPYMWCFNRPRYYEIRRELERL